MAATVTDLAIAPVKGMRVVAVQELELGPAGPAGDRAFVLVGADGGLVETSRTPELLQVAPTWDPASGTLGLRFPDGREVTGVPEPGERGRVSFYNGRPVNGGLVDGPLSQALSDHLGRPVRLMALDARQTGADDYPVTLMSTASLSALGHALPGGIPDPRRFRMTITIDGAGPWEEHGWAGQEVGVGEVTLRVVDPVPRCVVTTRDPERGRRDAPILKALAELRGKDDVTFGVWCEVARPGRVRVGDPVGPAVSPAS
jgi:uncharacterized protein YcbX